MAKITHDNDSKHESAARSGESLDQAARAAGASAVAETDRLARAASDAAASSTSRTARATSDQAASVASRARATSEEAASAASRFTQSAFDEAASNVTRFTKAVSGEAASSPSVFDILGDQTRHSFESAAALARARSLTDIAQVQTDFLSGSFDRMNRLGERYLAVLRSGMKSLPSNSRN